MPLNVRIAIIGGGLAGATVANALIQNPGFEVHIFESAPEFSERGLAVGLSFKSQHVLGHIFPSTKELLQKAGGVGMNTVRMHLVGRLSFRSSHSGL
jgi:salicylate hydroxylase